MAGFEVITEADNTGHALLRAEVNALMVN